MDQYSILKVLEGSPKGRLPYDTGWDQRPNAITALITAVQELEVDKPKREIVENAFRITKDKERTSLSPKPSLYSASIKSVTSTKGRYSLPGRLENNEFVSHIRVMKQQQQLNYKCSSLTEAIAKKELKSASSRRAGSSSLQRNDLIRPKPEFHIEEVDQTDWNTSHLSNSSVVVGIDSMFNIRTSPSVLKSRRPVSLLTPPGPNNRVRRKKSNDESPNFKPSPYASSTHTQTHSSTSASEATNTTPTRKPYLENSRALGIRDEPLDEEKLDEDLILESKASPFAYIEEACSKYQEECDKKVQKAIEQRRLKFQEYDKESEKKAIEEEAKSIKSRKEGEEMLKKAWLAKELADLQGFQSQLQNRQKKEEKLHYERKSVIDALDKARQAAAEAQQREAHLRNQKAREEEDLKKKKEEADQREKQQQQQQEKEAEEKRIAAEAAAATALAEQQETRQTETKKSSNVPELDGLILHEDIDNFFKSNEILKQYEEPTAQINGKDPTTKAFYTGAVKCINTPLNALADTNQNEIMSKVQHFSKLLAGQPVSGGGSMSNLFSSKSIPNGDLFVMKTLAFRFVKKCEADVTRGKSTVQPLATVGVYLCKASPAWASLVQAYMYKLCPFLVPFSYPQSGKSVQEYARMLGHELSGSETAIQQTFLERIKGYCTLYALMVLKFNDDGPFEIGQATDFFTIGSAWQIIAKSMKLEPQIDVTATVIHTILDILDDRMYALYKSQFTKLIRLFVFQYLPKIKSITPPTKSGSLSRLQTYLEKKYAIKI